MGHCFRLLQIAREIGEGKGIQVRRNNRKELLSIRKGEMEYDELIEKANRMIEDLDCVYENSNLPESVDEKLIENLLLKIRIKRYNLSLQ